MLQDVILTSGGSGAVEMAITVLANPGQNILLPKPGFSLYQCITGAKGVESRFYCLLVSKMWHLLFIFILPTIALSVSFSFFLQPERKWEIDFEGMEQMIDNETAAIVVTNPSNPCGSVFSQEHLMEIISC